MITVTAAIIEKRGLILAAQKKQGLHLAGYWEFPGGKVEPNETPEKCLQRELTEELGITCEIGNFFVESIHDYGNKTIRLLSYHVRHITGELRLTDHDEVRWLPVEQLNALNWAPADIPIVEALTAKHLTEQTLHYYNSYAAEYIHETIDLHISEIRDDFIRLIPEKSHILDLGCGSGRDSRVFLQHGYTVTAIDASSEVAQLTSVFLGQPVLVKKAQELKEPEQYDAIWACASLVHIPDCEMLTTLQQLAGALKPGGILYMSFKQTMAASTDSRGRYFNNCTISHLAEFFASIPEMTIIQHHDTLSLMSITPTYWLNIFAQKSI